MHARKRKSKERRRARKLAEQAWDAVDEGNLDLAEKLIRRAVGTQEDNPVLWHDQGMILSLRGNLSEAEQSFRTTLSLAPDFADAFAQLAAIDVRQGRLAEAVALQEQAVKYGPDVADYRQRLESYRSLAGAVRIREPLAPEDAPGVEVAQQQSRFDQAFSERLAGYDWSRLETDLTQIGCVLLSELLDADTCAMIRDWFDDDALFAKTVVMDRPEFGRGVYRYFRAPVPAVVNGLRRSVYHHIVRIANHWNELLNESDRFPAEWDEFRDECHRAGQSTPTPILLKYEAGGFNALHRDLRGEVFFPIQLAVVLSERGDESNLTPHGFQGGEFLFADSPARKKSRQRSITAGLGDGILFCTRDRLVSVGGAYGLQPVKHGVSRITAGRRVVLGLSFHEYR